MRDQNGRFVKGHFKDRSGEKYNRLTFVSIDHVHVSSSGERTPYWYMKCDCGGTRIGRASDVLSGHTKSCGCLQKEAISKARKIHGEADTRLYYIWENMKKRCYYKNNDKYKNYGERGIKICDEWLTGYLNFSEWAHANGYNDNMTIERIDVNDDYKPSNCTWIPAAKQALNKTSSKLVLINGKKYSPLDLEKIYGIPVKTIYARLSRGDKGEDVIRPLGARRFYKKANTEVT